MARFDTAGEIVNAAAAECGLTPVSNPFASSDPAFVQLCTLLTSAGREMYGLHQWNKLQKTHTITTVVPPDTGIYDLPDDFGYFIDQTGWSPVSGGTGLPLGGPLTPQDWTYLVNTNLASSTIYVSFRMADGQFWVLPAPPPTGVVINFEYMSRNWALDNDGSTEKDSVDATDDIVWYEPILITKFLKLRFQEAKGFDTTAAVGQFLTMFQSWTGKDVAAPVLSMARNCVFPYLGWRNIPETNYGLP